MTTAEAIGYAEPVVYVGAYVTLLFYEFPAYKRYKRRSLLLLCWASLLALFLTVYDFTVRISQFFEKEYLVYYSLRQLTWYVTMIIGTVGALMFLRDFERAVSASQAASGESALRKVPAPQDNQVA